MPRRKPRRALDLIDRSGFGLAEQAEFRPQGSNPNAPPMQIYVQAEPGGSHFWVVDGRGKKVLATSSKGFASERSAMTAAKRAAQRWYDKAHPEAAKSRTKSKKPSLSRMLKI